MQSTKSLKLAILALFITTLVIFSGCAGTTPTINHSPTIGSLTANPPSPIEVNQSTTITCYASDQDGDTLTYAWTKTGGTITGSGSAITWTAPAVVGTYTITCTVSDGELTATQSLTIEVSTLEPEILQGTVNGSVSNTLIFGATVTAISGTEIYTTATDLNGEYKLHLPVGTYTVTAEKETYNIATSTNVQISIGETKTVDLTLTTGTAGTPTLWFDYYLDIYTAPAQSEFRTVRKLSEFYPEQIKAEDLPKASPTGYTIYTYLRAYVDHTNNTGIKGFRFYSSTDQFGPYILLASVPIQMWEDRAYSRFYDYDPDLTPGIPSKYYAFSAWTDEGESSINIEGRVTPLDKFILAFPSNGATGVGTTPTFTWQSVSNVYRYDIEVYRKNNYGWYDWVWYRWDIPAGTTSVTYGDGGEAAEPLNPGDECLWIMYADGYNYTAVSMSYPRTFRP
ncbi:hypothetical protein CVT91_05440 [Candidatus Atribacteria bacterium HGW-Atribacteria-1]|nr:MAG: hypothetical protein CVT91_05440 [Candidatus Atribacteria bacterium HGW-Atribacteria-1]